MGLEAMNRTVRGSSLRNRRWTAFVMRFHSWQGASTMQVLFVAGFGAIVPDGKMGQSSVFYRETLGIGLEQDGQYFHTGTKAG